MMVKLNPWSLLFVATLGSGAIFTWMSPPLVDALCQSGIERWMTHCLSTNDPDWPKERARRRVASAGPSPIIVVGDSITSLSSLPATIEGSKIVNAGVGGANALTDFPKIIGAALGKEKARMIVVALGTNDTSDPDRFSRRYPELLAKLRWLGERTILVEAPPRNDGNDVSQINLIISAQGLPVISMEALIGIPTKDGVHLTKQGDVIWTSTVTAGIKDCLRNHFPRVSTHP